MSLNQIDTLAWYKAKKQGGSRVEAKISARLLLADLRDANAKGREVERLKKKRDELKTMVAW